MSNVTQLHSFDERESRLLSLMAARLEAQGIRGRSPILQGELSRTLAYAFLRCCVEGWKPLSPEHIPFESCWYTNAEGSHSDWGLEELDDRSKLRNRMVAYHVDQDDAEAIVDCCLTWTPGADATIPLPGTNLTNRDRAHTLCEVDVILAFAFGNRFVANGQGQRNGNREPGPINEKLAELVVDYYHASQSLRTGESPPEVWVQWEIADRIGDRIPCHVVCPEINREKDEVSYLSTSDVIEAIGPERFQCAGRALVIAHPDHLVRCMWVVGKGPDRYFRRDKHILPCGMRHPGAVTFDDDGWYDRESGQFWTARRHRFLIHEAIGRLSIYQGDRLAQAVNCLAGYRENLNRIGDDALVWQPKQGKKTFG
jgi:hypothetical protein